MDKILWADDEIDLLKPHIPLLIPDETGPFSWILSYSRSVSRRLPIPEPTITPTR